MSEPITSRHNEQLNQLRKLHDRKHRERSGSCSSPRARTCSTEALRAGRSPQRSSTTPTELRCRALASAGGLPRSAVAGDVLASAKRARVGLAHDRGLGSALEPARAGRPVLPAGGRRLPARGRRPGQRRSGAALGACLRPDRWSCSARGRPTRSARRRCGPAWARSSASRSRAPRSAEARSALAGPRDRARPASRPSRCASSSLAAGTISLPRRRAVRPAG